MLRVLRPRTRGTNRPVSAHPRGAARSSSVQLALNAARQKRIFKRDIHASANMVRTSIFLSNRSQAVRLPKDVAFPEGVRSVVILREGRRRVIVPADAAWDDFFEQPGVDLGERDQLQAQVRESF